MSVWVRFEHDSLGGMYVVGDEDGEFARAGSIELALPYVADLLYGPGTMREGGLRERTPRPCQVGAGCHNAEPDKPCCLQRGSA